MADTVNIGGKPVKKMYVAAGIGGALIIGVGVYRYRKQQAAATATAQDNAAAQTGTGTSVTDSGIDPATGYPYGSAEDAASLTQMGSYNSPTSYLGGGNPYGGGGYYPGSGGTGFTSNPQWAQAAEAYMVGNTGADPAVVGNALGKYIVGSPVGDSDHAIINQAIAFEGIPPVPGPDGFPPSIRTAPVSPPPGGGTGTITLSGFSVTPHKGAANFGWTTNAVSSRLTVTGARGKGTGTSHYDQTVNGTHASIPLNRGKYNATVKPTGGTAALSKTFTVT